MQFIEYFHNCKLSHFLTPTGKKPKNGQFRALSHSLNQNKYQKLNLILLKKIFTGKLHIL